MVLAVLAGVLVGAQRARAALLEERCRIARDLHDVVGRDIGAITAQAGAGRVALDAGVDEERSACPADH